MMRLFAAGQISAWRTRATASAALSRPASTLYYTPSTKAKLTIDVSASEETTYKWGIFKPML
jgi:hypothetical protein